VRINFRAMRNDLRWRKGLWLLGLGYIIGFCMCFWVYALHTAVNCNALNGDL